MSKRYLQFIAVASALVMAPLGAAHAQSCAYTDGQVIETWTGTAAQHVDGVGDAPDNPPHSFDANFAGCDGAALTVQITWDTPADLDLEVQGADGESLGSGNPPGISMESVTFTNAETGTYTSTTVSFANPDQDFAGTATVSLAAEVSESCDPTGLVNLGSAVVDAGVLRDFAALDDTALYGAFVHFNAGTLAEQNALLDAHGLQIANDFRKYTRAAFVTGAVSSFQTISVEPIVFRIEHNAPLRYLGETQSWATRARVAHEDAGIGPFIDGQGRVVDGADVTLGVIDSGVFGAHPDFAENLVHNFKLVFPDSIPTAFVSGPTDDVPSYLDIGIGDSESQVGGHGTHVTGTVAGRGAASNGYPEGATTPYVAGTYAGAAPGADLIHWGNGAGLLVLDTAAAYRHMLENLEEPRTPAFASLKAVNNSYGQDPAPYDPTSVASCMIKQIVEAGVVMAFAASNEGGDGSTDQTSPACKDPTPGVICVASYDDAEIGARDGALSGFSSRGKRVDEGLSTDGYPDIAAPGSNITSTCVQGLPSQAVCTTGAETDWQPMYGTISGTSMATPHVVGIIGLMAQVDPDITPAEIERIIALNARKVGDGYQTDTQIDGATTHFGYGAGLIDVPAILTALGATPSGADRANTEFVIFDADEDFGGGEDVLAMSMMEVETAGTIGVRYTMTLAGEPTLDATYTVYNNVGGQPFSSSVAIVGGEAVIPEAAPNNSSVPTEVALNGTSLTMTVPYSAFRYPEAMEPVHNIRVAVTAQGQVVDWAPSNVTGAVATDDQQTMFGRAWTVLTQAAPPPSNERTCVAPGITQFRSPFGTTGLAETGTDQEDLVQGWISEPSDQAGKVVFTLKMANLDPQPIPGHRWYFYFRIPDDSTDYWVALDTTELAPQFLYGTRSPLETPAGAVGTYVTLGELDGASEWLPDGTIRMVMDKSVLDLQTGDDISMVAASIRQSSNPVNAAGLTVDSAGGDKYTLVGNDTCADPDGNIDSGENNAPVVMLTASTLSGDAPLTVEFDLTGTVDVDDDPLSFTVFVDDVETPATIADNRFTLEPFEVGSYDVHVVADDGNGGVTQSETLTITANEPGTEPAPGRVFAVLTHVVDENDGLTVRFDATASYKCAQDCEDAANHQELDEPQFTFFYADDTADETAGEASQDGTGIHTYGAAGTFRPYVLVQDANGNSAAQQIEVVVSESITVGDQPAVNAARLTADYDRSNPAVPLQVVFDASQTTVADGFTITSYAFVFGDGDSVTTTSPTVQHVYTQAGTYEPEVTVTFTATDDTSRTETSTAKSSSVAAGSAPGAAPVSAGGGSGGLGWLVLVPLALAGLRRRRTC